MDRLAIIERLTSLKHTAFDRSLHQAKKNVMLGMAIKAYVLEKGIEQIIIEIQNNIYADVNKYCFNEPLDIIGQCKENIKEV